MKIEIINILAYNLRSKIWTIKEIDKILMKTEEMIRKDFDPISWNERKEVFKVVNFSEVFLKEALEDDCLMEKREREREESGETLNTEGFLDLNNVDLGSTKNI